jgi:secondary thiamine-phosphate synthase enzyme
MNQTLTLATRSREALVDITGLVAEAVAASGVDEGIAMLYCPHTTGALTIQEAADPDVARDLVATFARLVPLRGDYRHVEGNADAHAKAALIGCAQTFLVEQGRPKLGQWQGIFYCELDGPRERTLWLKIIPG